GAGGGVRAVGDRPHPQPAAGEHRGCRHRPGPAQHPGVPGVRRRDRTGHRGHPTGADRLPAGVAEGHRRAPAAAGPRRPAGARHLRSPDAAAVAGQRAGELGAGADVTATLERPATGAPAARARTRAQRRAGHRVPRWLAIPAVVSLLITGLYPAAAGLALALTDSSLARPLRGFVGFDNFVAAAESVAFGGSLVRSALFAVFATALAVVAGMAGALALQARGGRFGLLGAVLVLPMVTPPVSVGVAWKLLLAPVGGGLTGLWDALGVSGFNPLGSGVGA